MELRKLPLVMVVLAGLSVFTLLAGLLTLVVRGGGGSSSATTPHPSVTPSGTAAPTVTATTPPPDLANPAKPKILHALPPGAATPPRISAAIGSLLNVSALGPGVTADVIDALTGQPLYSVGATTSVPPASTAKLATAAAALRVMSPMATLSTAVYNGAVPNQVVIVGGGDPTLAGAHPDPAGTYPPAASLAALAKAASKSLHGKTVTVAYDATLYTGPTTAPGWKPSYVASGNVAPVSALEVDEGRTSNSPTAARSSDPALQAAQQFAALLVHDGVKVTGTPKAGLPAAGAKPLAKVSSAPVTELVERMLQVSDNDLAESLARQVALKENLPATFAGGAQAVAQVVAKLGVDPTSMHMVDGSGLSTLDALQAVALVTLGRAATLVAHPELKPVLSGLPVAGFLGTLSGRFQTAATAVGIGAVRAKTGTLTNVSSLAGVVVDLDGRQLVFALLASHVPTGGTLAAEAALDRVAATLAGCGCR